jgi:hypothetical protein
MLQGHVASEPLQPAAARARQADAWLGQSELGMIGGDGKVAGGHDLRAAAEGQAVNPRDDGLQKVESGA